MSSPSRRMRLAAAALLFVAGLAAAFPPAASSVNGVFDARERGCYCHSSSPSDAVGFTVAGLPGRYVAGAVYTVWINVSFSDVPAAPNASQGGFYFEATAGSVSAPPAMAGLVQVRGLEATHTANGSRMRSWVLNWTAPDVPGQVVTFYVFVNTVNGNKSETFGTDHWTQKTVTIGVGDEPQVQGPPAPTPPFAIGAPVLLAVGVGFGVFALYTFYTARRPAGEGAPDNRLRRERRKRGSRP